MSRPHGVDKRSRCELALRAGERGNSNERLMYSSEKYLSTTRIIDSMQPSDRTQALGKATANRTTDNPTVASVFGTGRWRTVIIMVRRTFVQRRGQLGKGLGGICVYGEVCVCV